jgi:hypothetical protein
MIAVVIIGIALIPVALFVLFLIVPWLLVIAGGLILFVSYYSGPPDPFLVKVGIGLLVVGGFFIVLQLGSLSG